MTLFHLREFWTTTCGSDVEEEEFDKCSICITNIDNSSDGFDKIIVGSFNGILRVYKVELNAESKNEQNLFQISDLLLEMDFKEPILQVASGFLLATNTNQLAILHPTKLCVYSISSTSGVTDHGTSYNILLIYELKFDNQPKAANMLIGSLGQSKGKDIICVQNTDCVFNFYENESFSFGYSWSPNRKCAPMEFTYIPNRDLIILVDELYQIKCYQYQELAMNSSTKISTLATNDDLMNRKECVCDWVYNFGEFVIGMQPVQMDMKWYVVILGSKNLCVLHENGSLFFVKKFDVNPSAFCAFANDNRDSLIILIATQMCNMLVYQNDILRWATKIPFVPVSINRANLNDISGSIVLMSDKGHLTVGYLGTNPSLKIISMPSADDYNQNSSSNEKIEEELRSFKKLINMESNQQIERESNLSDYLQLNLLDCVQNKINDQFLILFEILSLKIIPNVKLLINQNDFYEIQPTEHFFASLEDTVRIELQARFRPTLQMLPLSNKIKCSFMFHSDNVLRIVNKSMRIPFNSLINPSSSQTKSIHKYWIKINIIQQNNADKPSITLALLFDHILSAEQNNSNGFSICFNNYEQIQASIKMIKMDTSSTLVQIESNDLAGLYSLLRELFHRIRVKGVNYRIGSFVLNFHPLNHLRANIKNRMDCKLQLIKFKKELASFSQHHRVLQKRILVKSKDKTPASLENLEKLLTLIQKRISKNIDQIILYDKMFQIRNYHVWLNLNILKIILKKSKKSPEGKAPKSLERFIKLISANQLSNFTMEWEELFLSSLHEIFNLGKDIGNVVKIMDHNNNDNQDYEHLVQVLQDNVFKKLANELIPIEFL